VRLKEEAPCPVVRPLAARDSGPWRSDINLSPCNGRQYPCPGFMHYSDRRRLSTIRPVLGPQTIRLARPPAVLGFLSIPPISVSLHEAPAPRWFRTGKGSMVWSNGTLAAVSTPATRQKNPSGSGARPKSKLSRRSENPDRKGPEEIGRWRFDDRTGEFEPDPRLEKNDGLGPTNSSAGPRNARSPRIASGDMSPLSMRHCSSGEPDAKQRRPIHVARLAGSRTPSGQRPR